MYFTILQPFHPPLQPVFKNTVGHREIPEQAIFSLFHFFFFMSYSLANAASEV